MKRIGRFLQGLWYTGLDEFVIGGAIVIGSASVLIGAMFLIVTIRWLFIIFCVLAGIVLVLTVAYALGTLMDWVSYAWKRSAR